MFDNKQDIDKSQYSLNFEKHKWPPQEQFPLNFKKQLGRTTEQYVYSDIKDSSEYIILTGFTSLSNLIDFFGTNDNEQLQKVKILIGFEPNIRGRKKYLKQNLDKEIKEYWLKKGISIILGGAVFNLIEKIRNNDVEFKFRDRLHAKIYVGDTHAILGSSNFSKSGLVNQEEANIRIPKDSEKYYSIKKIANTYYDEAMPFNNQIIALLENLIKPVTWQEALARAISEVIEGKWLNNYSDILEKLQQSKLWPTQWKGVAQAITILQSQSNVLIADPTGAGKTKLCTSVVLALQQWLYEIGESEKTNSLVVCPPLVISKWRDEFRSLNTINNNQLSMGLLSSNNIKRPEERNALLMMANILTIDEAHNYLAAESLRTKLINTNKSEFKILATATPISKRIDDLLKLVSLLDIDNLSDDDFEKYKALIKKQSLKNSDEDINDLRTFISKFTVRRTKKALNKEIVKQSNLYTNKLNETCKFPEQIEKTYETSETEDDKKIVEQINILAKKIKGITYLTKFHKPKFEISKEESCQEYISRRIVSAKALSVYMIRAALRSSHVALVEHIDGSEEAMKFFNFKGKQNKTGNKLRILSQEIQKDKLPYRSSIFKEHMFPEWLLSKEKYHKACRVEIEIYREISKLAKQLSGRREIGKVKLIENLTLKHKDILAFDSTVITLYYLQHLFQEHYPNRENYIGTGDSRQSEEILKLFNLESKSNSKKIALCSDQMSESVDLQKASCLVLLDLPSVLRIVEQRIGRVDRMDSSHKSIEIFWPNDSPEYSLNADQRLFETNELADKIYGTNFNIPESLRQKHFSHTNSTKKIIKEYKDFVDKDESWSGIKDSFQSIIDLKEGDSALIEESIYDEIKDVEATIKTRVSFVNSNVSWCFIARRGDKNKSPKWYFIDEKDGITTDFKNVCIQLRTYLSSGGATKEWNDQALNKYINILHLKELELLPPKKKRALEVAIVILKKWHKRKGVDLILKRRIAEMLNILDTKKSHNIDYERLADEWINILQPFLNEKRRLNKRKKRVHNLNSLKSDYLKIELTPTILDNMIEKLEPDEQIDTKIAACIIGVKKNLPYQKS